MKTKLALGISIAAAIIFGSGGYYATHMVRQSKAMVPETQMATDTPVGIITTEGATSTYADAGHGFSIEYPALLELKTSGLGTGNFFHPSAEGLISVHSQMPYGTKSDDGYVTLMVGVSPDPEDVGGCMVAPQSSEESVSNVSTTLIDGVSFLTYDVGDAATGHFTDDKVYHALKNNVCYEVRKRTEFTGPGRLSAEDQKIQDDSLAAAIPEIDPIIQSFKFISSPADGAQPPTCALSSDKPTYALGDVINLTWTSKGATRALWNQFVDRNTGVRAVIVPPEATPGVRGSAATIANIEGYQPIRLQVVGPGGFGTCSTSVEVTHSEAKPSITVTGITVKQSPSDINSSDMTVVLKGTATNGALYNDEVNFVLFDASYAGPFDEQSIYKVAFSYDGRFYSGGTGAHFTDDSVPFETWTSTDTYIPVGVTHVRVLAYPFSSISSTVSAQPLVNTVLTVTR